MDENPLDKVLRLAAPNPRKMRLQKQGMRLGTPYRTAWGNVSVGDVVELGTELWKAIPSSSYPGKPISDPAKAALGSSPAAQQLGSTAAMAGQPQPGGPPQGPGAPGSPGGMPGAGGMPGGAGATSTLYLQDLRHPAKYDTLTLPASHIVTIVPVLP